jgi:hypothetical protein
MKNKIISLIAVIGLIGWSCTKIETNQGLKQSVEQGIADINTAVGRIYGSTGYQLLSTSSGDTKSDAGFTDSLSLALVAGIYDFQPDTIMRFHHFSPYRLFKKTGSSDFMIVNLPEMLVMHPKYLHYYEPADTLPSNNFTIKATGYHLFYNLWNSYDYKLAAGFTLNSEDLGSMDVSSTSSSFRTNSYLSEFTFPEGYSISASWQDGDTTTSSFTLSSNSGTLFKETSEFIWHQNHRSERQYTLTIGDVEIKRATGMDSIQVFLGGVLQNAGAALISDSSDSSASVCQKRDFLLKFNDGTTEKLSNLINPVREQLSSLRDSLHNMYFAKNIVDYIALSIYYNTH